MEKTDICIKSINTKNGKINIWKANNNSYYLNIICDTEALYNDELFRDLLSEFYDSKSLENSSIHLIQDNIANIYLSTESLNTILTKHQCKAFYLNAIKNSLMEII